MTTTRMVLRGAASALAAAALLVGATACTDDEGDEPSETGTAQEADPSDSGSTDPEESGTASDGGGDSPFSRDELDAASARFVDILQVLDDGDWEAACGMVLDPTTGAAPEGDRLQECVDGVESELGGRSDLVDPGAFDSMDASMVEAEDTGDGTVALSVLGNDLDIPMAPGDDGRWYLVIPF
ncbi:hypothetical protein [Brachybacterium ginsengisoli]|nr:hypothetical protein [Brachybacterium ginsengisoli]